MEVYTNEKILDLLKIDLGELNPTIPRKQFMLTVIETARAEVERQGITIDETSLSDAMLIEQYAAEMYRKRAQDNPRYSTMTKYRTHNRLLSEKGRTI